MIKLIRNRTNVKRISKSVVRWVWLLYGIGALGNDIAIASKHPPEKDKRAVVFVEEVLTHEIFDLLTYPARLVPKIQAALLSEADGIVSKILAPLGTSVSRNREILRITHTDPVYQYAPLVVTAPVSGVVSSMEVSEGSRVAKGQNLATITNPNQIRILIEVAATDISSITQGLQGTLRLSSDDSEIRVKVSGISPLVDPATGTAPCELMLVDKSVKPPPGLVGRVTFQLGFHQGIQIPEHAVVYRGKDTFVRAVENGRATLVPIVLGLLRHGSVEVVQGLLSGMAVIVRSNQYVSEGEEVIVQRSEAVRGE